MTIIFLPAILFRMVEPGIGAKFSFIKRHLAL
jgi:hypothetical protein